MTTNKDLFDDSTMTFGEHLEVLRFHLIRAILGLVLSVAICLVVGEQLVRLIRQPIDRALRKANVAGSQVEDNIRGFSFLDWIKNQIFPPTISEKDLEILNKNESMTQVEKKVVEVDVAPFDLLNLLHQVSPDTFPEPDASIKEKPPIKLPLQSEAFGYFRRTAEKIEQPVTLNVQEAFMTYMKVSFIAGFVIASPWIFYQLWLFVAAGLYPHERKYVHLYLPISVGLFLGGVGFCFYAVLPVVLDFLLGFNNRIGLTAQIRISEWISFAVTLPLMFGISFQLPLVMLFLTKINIFQVEQYKSQWRLAVLAISIISMVLTPTPDPATMMMMMIPLLFLYGLGIGLCYWTSPSSPLGEPA